MSVSTTGHFLLIVLHGVQGVTGNVMFQISDLVSLFVRTGDRL